MNDKDREPKIHPSSHVDDDVILGDWTVVHENVNIHGKVEIGRAGWILPYAVIGGGQKELGRLQQIGDFLHMGMRSFINIADVVTIGDQVGLGMETKLYTHGGYLNRLDGFPFQRGRIVIGNEVWLPNAIVLPNVVIGSSVVVAARSLVNRSIPSGCLAGGIPAKVLKHGIYKSPEPKYRIKHILKEIRLEAKHYNVKDIGINPDHDYIEVGKTAFFPLTRRIQGSATKDTERVKDLFRRHGVRFRYYDNNGEYREWD